MTKDEALKWRHKIENSATYMPDSEAVKNKDLYPTFKSLCKTDKKYPLGFRFRYGKNLFKTLQPNFKFTAVYPPTEGTESLYERIDEVHEGTKADPIPYEGNMTLVKGKFYTQNNVVYECVRDSEIAVHQPLSELIDVYVKEVI